MKTIWHIGAWNRNIGDWSLMYSMHRMLNEQAQEAIHFHLIDSQRTYFHQGLVDQMNEEADLVLVGGGGLIFHRPEDKSVSGWSFNIECEKLDQIQKPLVVYGIGYNQFAFNPPPLPEKTWCHLRKLREKAALFTVRDSWTQEILKGKGIESDVIPDPGICVYDRPIEFKKDRPTIAVNLAGDRIDQRYPRVADHLPLTDALRRALCEIVKYGYRVLMIPHLPLDHFEYRHEWERTFPEGTLRNAKYEFPYLYAPEGESLYPHVPFFGNLYRQVDLTLGMRFHSCVLALGCGTPFIPLGSHPKLKWLCEDIGISRYSLPMVSPSYDTTEKMTETIMKALLDPLLRSETERARDQAVKELRAFNERVVSLL